MGEGRGIYSVAMFHVAADDISFAATFLKVTSHSFCRVSSPNHNRSRWVVIWLWVQTWQLCHLYCLDVPKGKTRLSSCLSFLALREMDDLPGPAQRPRHDFYSSYIII